MMYELELMVGSDAVSAMAGRWEEMCKKLVPREGTLQSLEQELQLIKHLDQMFRGSGVNSKGHPLFTMHEVTNLYV